MKRPNPTCSLVRASNRLAERKAAALDTTVQAPGASAMTIRPLDGARALTSGTELDPRDLLGIARVMTAYLLGDLAHMPAEEAPEAIVGLLMDAIAHGYHARMLEAESTVPA